MLILNRHVEVSIHGQAADIEWILERLDSNKWSMIIEGVSEISLASKDSGLSEPQPIDRIKKEFILTDEQASATLALFIGEIENDSELNRKLYDIAEKVWKGVESYYRPIP